MSYKYPLATSTWDEAEYEAIRNVTASGIFTMGAKVAEFEKDFAQYLDSKYCVMVNSGSSANLLMVAALFYCKNEKYKLCAGDEVIVPAVSWSTTYYPLYQYGLKLKFVDIDMETLNYDLTQLNDAINEKTRVIMAVNLLGNPNDFEAIKAMIEGKEVILLEDNCESLGAEYNRKKTGTFGVMGTFSTFFSHHISTMEGGVVATEDEELYHILLALRAHGWTRNLPANNRVTGVKVDDNFEESFKFVLPGYNLRPLEMSGAIGIEQVKKLPKIVTERQKNGELLKKLMTNHDEILIQKEIGCSSWFGFSLIIRPNSSLSRPQLIEKLNTIGFEVRPIVAGNFAKNEVVKNYFNYTIFGKLRNANHIDQKGLFIGNHHYSMEESILKLSKI